MAETQTLTGKRVAILISPEGTEEVEFAKPRDAVTEAGATVTVISTEAGQAQAYNHLDKGATFTVDKTFDEVSPDDFDALIIPGGTVGADTLRASEAAIDFVEAMVTAGKPTGVICHGPWLLVEADVVDGRTLTSWPTLATDIENAGGSWVDQEVEVDDGLVSSRKPDDLPAFCAKIVEEFAEGEHLAEA